jgi:hypothetical protein
MITYQFSSSANWSEVWQGTLNAAPDTIKPAYRFFPIPDYEVPILIDNPIIAISASVPDAPETWKYAGTAFQKIRTGLLPTIAPNSFTASRPFYREQISILRFDRVAPTYSIVLRIPYWIRSISLGIWEYTGPILDSTDEKLNQILTTLNP